MRSDPEVQAAVRAYQLGFPRLPVRGRSGEMLGRGTGSSLEFQEYREYTPGDDIRHLDWAAYARSDSLMVRLYREEISPQLEVVLDASQSLLAGNGLKSLVSRQLASTLALMASRLGGRAAVHVVDDHRPVHKVSLESIDQLTNWATVGRASLLDALIEQRLTLRPQSMRVVISDFLFPHDPEVLIRKLSAGAGALWVIQVLSAWEQSPTDLGGRRLIDLETGAELDLVLGRATIEKYRQRLLEFQRSLLSACRRVQAPLLTVTADDGLSKICRSNLVSAGLLHAS